MSAQRVDSDKPEAAWFGTEPSSKNDQVSDSPQPDRLINFNLLDAPGHLLRRNHQRSYEIFTRHVGDDVTRQQIALLIALARNPGSSQRELVEETGIDKSTLKEMLGRMVTRGWVKRERDPKDSRAWTMRTTLEGETLLADRIESVANAQREILAPLSEDEQALFLRSLRILIGFEKSSAP